MSAGRGWERVRLWWSYLWSRHYWERQRAFYFFALVVSWLGSSIAAFAPDGSQLRDLAPALAAVLVPVGAIVAALAALRRSFAVRDPQVFASQHTRESTDRFAALIGQTRRMALGTAVEIQCSPYLTSDLESSGWDARNVTLRVSNEIQAFDFTDIPPYVDPGDNKPYFAIRAIPHVTKDSEKKPSDATLELKLTPTSWNDINTHQNYFKEHEAERHARMEKLFRDSSIPYMINGRCTLHALVSLGDDAVVMTLRPPGSHWYPNSFSISCEEGLQEVDFTPDDAGLEGPCARLFTRTLFEEIYPLMNYDKRDHPPEYNDLIRRARDSIESARVWSVFLEEDTGNLSIFGVARLKLGLLDFKNFYNECVERNSSFFRRDNEGDLYYCSEDDLAQLLVGETIRARSIFGDNVREVGPQNLHPTSAYRAYHYVAAKCPGKLRRRTKK